VAISWQKDLLFHKIPTEVESRLDWIYQNVPKDSKIVDIGCANGSIFGKDFKSVTRVDIDNHPKLENFYQANAEDLPFKDKEFDIAVMGEILEHVENPQKALNEAIRVANRVIITVPYEHEWHHPYTVPFDTLEREEKELGKPREEIYQDNEDIKYFKGDNYQHLRHQRYYTYSSLKDELSKVSEHFTIVRLRKTGISHFGAIIDASTPVLR